MVSFGSAPVWPTEPRMEEKGERGSTLAAGALSALLEEIAREMGRPPEVEWTPALEPGAVVDRFEIVKEVGRGGFGTVYEARDRELSRTVAFKVLRAGSRPEVREERLLHEAEAAARLSHPNIVTLFDVGRCEQGPYLVLELLRGETLGQRLARGRLPLKEALRIGAEVAKGLAHAHSKGVVHRDLTPGNVYLCQDGQVKVLDLGMAHAFGRRKVEGGTPAYMAPEQLQGAPEDERTDVFALGVILHRALSGALPFLNEGELLRRRPAPALEVPGVPALGDLVGRMLEKSAVGRPRDCGEVLASLLGCQRELDRAATGMLPPVRRGRPRARLAWLLAAGALVAVGVAGLAFQRRMTASAPASIAVLPFADMSPQRDQEYFSDGLAEEILNALARVEGLRVPGRTSSFYFKGKSVELAEIGQKLNVSTVLEGSVRKEGNRVRVTAQVVRVPGGEHLWSETYDRDLTGVFAVQEEIAASVVKALRVKLLPARSPGAGETSASSPDAYRQYLTGQESLMNAFSPLAPPEKRRAATQAFERAVELDPRLAIAWGALSRALLIDAYHSGSAAEKAAGYRRAFEALDRQIALVPDLDEARTMRAFLRSAIQWDWAGARADLELALRLNPNSADANRAYGILLLDLGQVQEARSVLLKAIHLDPLMAWNWSALGFLYEATGQFGRARAAIEHALELSPSFSQAQANLATTFLLEGRLEAALAAFESASEEEMRLFGAALVHHDLGHATEARKALRRLIARSGDAISAGPPDLLAMVLHKGFFDSPPDEPRYRVATVYAWRGDNDRAFEWLEQAYAKHDYGLRDIKLNPLLRKIRGDPRYPALLRRLNLPVD